MMFSIVSQLPAVRLMSQSGPESPASSASACHRSDIQGLRAIAVVAVVIFHLAPDHLPGGFVGVDIFFVISGFLITRLLAASSGRPADLGRFLVRRARRLLPAAGLTLTVTALAGMAILPRTRWDQLATETIAAALQYENWLLAVGDVGYSSGGTPSAVQHFWSLSVEWQTYVVWVALFGVAAIGALRRLPAALVLVSALAALSFISAISSAWLGQDAAYFAAPLRFWQFGAGALLALLPPLAAHRTVRETLAIGGLAALVASVIILDPIGHPSWPALLPVLGTVAIIAAGSGPEPGVVGRALGSGAMRWIGDRSYAIYLWHWPVLVFWVKTVGQVPRLATAAAVLAVTMLLAVVSTRFVEEPIRRRLPSRLALVLTTALTVTPLLVAAPVVISTAGLRAQLSAAPDPDHPGALALPEEAASLVVEAPVIPDVAVAVDDFGDAGPGLHCLIPRETPVTCTYGDLDARRVIVLVGDSHAWQWMPAFDVLGVETGWRIETLVRPSCPLARTPVVIPEIGDDGSCDAWRNDVIDLLVQERPDLVVTAGLTPYGYEAVDYQVADVATFARGYRAVWQRLENAGIAVAALRDTPYFPEDVPACFALDPDDRTSCDAPRSNVLDAIEDPLERAAAESGVPLLDLSDSICRAATCPVVVGNVLVYRDRHHLTATYARTLSPELLRQLEASGLFDDHSGSPDEEDAAGSPSAAVRNRSPVR